MSPNPYILRSLTLPCPFVHCQSTDTTLVEVDIERFDGSFYRSWRAICRSCNAQGPWGGAGEAGKYLAADRWNSTVLREPQKAQPDGDSESGKPSPAAG